MQILADRSSEAAREERLHHDHADSYQTAINRVPLPDPFLILL